MLSSQLSCEEIDGMLEQGLFQGVLPDFLRWVPGMRHHVSCLFERLYEHLEKRHLTLDLKCVGVVEGRESIDLHYIDVFVDRMHYMNFELQDIQGKKCPLYWNAIYEFFYGMGLLCGWSEEYHDFLEGPLCDFLYRDLGLEDFIKSFYMKDFALRFGLSDRVALRGLLYPLHLEHPGMLIGSRPSQKARIFAELQKRHASSKDKLPRADPCETLGDLEALPPLALDLIVKHVPRNDLRLLALASRSCCAWVRRHVRVCDRAPFYLEELRLSMASCWRFASIAPASMGAMHWAVNFDHHIYEKQLQSEYRMPRFRDFQADGFEAVPHLKPIDFQMALITLCSSTRDSLTKFAESGLKNPECDPQAFLMRFCRCKSDHHIIQLFLAPDSEFKGTPYHLLYEEYVYECIMFDNEKTLMFLLDQGAGMPTMYSKCIEAGALKCLKEIDKHGPKLRARLDLYTAIRSQNARKSGIVSYLDSFSLLGVT